MLPGVVKDGSDLKSFGRFQRGDIVAVNLTSNSSAVGVGTLARDSEDLYMSGGQGVCVKMIHVFGDKLWAIEPTVTLQIPLSAPMVKAPTLSNEQDFPALGAEPVPSPSTTIQEQMEKIAINEGGEQKVSEEVKEENSLNTDVVLRSMFLSALKLHKKEITASLPILVGTFYPLYVQKQAPNPDKPITVKDTSFKKVSTFMKRMNDDGFIVMREETKGVDKIVSVNYDHPQLLSHIVRKSQNDNKSEGGTSHLLLTKMTELYVVNDATKKLFNSVGVAEGKALDNVQIKNHIKDYVARNKLLNVSTKEVILDDTLVEICVGQRESGNVITKDLEQVIGSVLSLMDNTFEMRSQSGPQMKGGKKPIIQLTTATRSGNKKVTLVSNLEAYGINVADFSKTCKIGVQASTSITKVPGTNIDQFQIQGNHVKFIHNLLTETYKVARGNITGLEFAKKEKSKKK
jgi:translation initiation factor 2D